MASASSVKPASHGRSQPIGGLGQLDDLVEPFRGFPKSSYHSSCAPLHLKACLKPAEHERQPLQLASLGVIHGFHAEHAEEETSE